jgi:ribosomal protein S12 methylthiotransferase
MLEKMRRETTQQYIVDLLQKIRSGIPGVALRTTFIAGFPGETEAHFKTLLDFIEATRFERLGVFTYSNEDGTLGAKMAGQIADPVKKQRRDAAMAVQQRISRKLGEAQRGKIMKVLVEKEATAKEMRQELVSSWENGLLRAPESAMSGIKGKFLVARGQSDAPDIDGRIYVQGTVVPGDFAEVKISSHGDYDLIAQCV